MVSRLGIDFSYNIMYHPIALCISSLPSQVLTDPRPPARNIAGVLALTDIAADNIHSCANLPHLVELEAALSTLAKPLLLFVNIVFTTQRSTRVSQCLSSVIPDRADGLLELRLDRARWQGSKQIHLVRRDQHGDFLRPLARLRIGVSLLQIQQHMVQVLCCFVQPSFLVDGSGVHDENDGADIFRVSEGGGRVVAQLAVAGSVEDDKATRALESWVAGGAVVRRGGDVRVGQEGFDGEGDGGGVGCRDGAALGL